MSKQEKKALSPALRFPEFRDESEWELKELGDCLDYLQPTNYLVSSTAYDDKYKTPVLTAGKTFVLGYTNETEGVFDKKLPVIIFDDFTTASKYVDFPFKAKSSAMKILLAKDDANIKFCYESMQMMKYEVGVHERHWISIFSKLSVPTPKPNEQQKIADCLSSIDEVITAQTQKLDSLKAHKKGLMQQLFPSEGETLPKLRFPEFRDKGEWNGKQLGKLATIVRGGSPRPIDNYLTPDKEGLNWLKIGDVDKESKYITHTKERVIVAALSKTREVHPGDLIMSNSMSFGRPYIMKIKSCIHDGWIAVTEISGEINRDYLYYFILSSSAQMYFTNAAAGGGIKNLNADIIKLLPVSYPGLEDEQQKIADCLASIDEMITAQTQKIEALKNHKQGLMQQLFPVIDEVVYE